MFCVIIAAWEATENYLKELEAYTSHSPKHLNISIALPHEFKSNFSSVGVHITPEISKSEQNLTDVSSYRKVFVKPILNHYEFHQQTTRAPDELKINIKPEFRVLNSFPTLPSINISNFILKNKQKIMQLHEYFFPRVIKFNKPEEEKLNASKIDDLQNYLYNIYGKEVPIERKVFVNKPEAKHHKIKILYQPLKSATSINERPFFKLKSSLLNQTKSMGSKIRLQTPMLFFPEKFPIASKRKFHLPITYFEPSKLYPKSELFQPIFKHKIAKTLHSLTAGFHKNNEMHSKSYQITPSPIKSKMSVEKSIMTLDHKKYPTEFDKLFEEIAKDYGDLGHNLGRSAGMRFTNDSQGQ